MKSLLIIMLILVLASACSTTTSYIKEGSSASEVGRLVMKKQPALGVGQWEGGIDQVLTLDRESVVKQGQKYNSVVLSPGRYAVRVSCYNILLSETAEPSVVVDVAAMKEYVLDCEAFKSDEKDFLGFKRKKVEVRVVETNDFNPVELDRK